MSVFLPVPLSKQICQETFSYVKKNLAIVYLSVLPFCVRTFTNNVRMREISVDPQKPHFFFFFFLGKSWNKVIAREMRRPWSCVVLYVSSWAQKKRERGFFSLFRHWLLCLLPLECICLFFHCPFVFEVEVLLCQKLKGKKAPIIISTPVLLLLYYFRLAGRPTHPFYCLLKSERHEMWCPKKYVIPSAC